MNTSGLRFAQRLFGLGPDALGDQGVGFAGRDHASHERQRFVGHGEAERRITRRETRHAQDAHRVFGERLRNVAQPARLQIAAPAVGDR